MTAKPFVFPIRPRFVDMFRAGTKSFEFRTRRPSVSAGDSALIYECAPVSMVVATAIIGEIVDGTLDDVWDLTGMHGGISPAEFTRYFEPRTRAVAIEMRSITWLAQPIPLALGMTPQPGWSRWRGEWPLGETTT